ncbi:MAG: FtsX-like permease family protein [Candidatus Thorarchaeota archaeon]
MFLMSRLTSKTPQLLVTLLVFSLSSGVLGGLLFYMDSTSSEVLEEMTEYLPVDMEIKCTQTFYESTAITLDTILDVVKEQSIVETAEAVIAIEGFDRLLPEGQFRSYVYLGVDDSFFTSFGDSIELLPEALPLSQNSCYIESALFEFYNLEIGSTYTANVFYRDANYQTHRDNRTFIIAGQFKSSFFTTDSESEADPSSSLRLITTKDGMQDHFGFVGQSSTDGIFDRIWMKFDSDFILENNPNVVESALDDIKKKIEQRILPFASVTEFEILGVVYGYNSWASTMTVIALAFSIPTLVMGMMLVVNNSQLNEDDRRRDLGTLTTRGSSGWQSFNWVLSNALVTGIVGSFGAVLTGALSAIYSGGVKEFLQFDNANSLNFSLLLEPTSIAVVFLFSFTLGFIVALPSAIKALLMTPEEAHLIIERSALQGIEKFSNPLWEILAVAVSGYLIFPLLSMVLYGNFPPTTFLLFAIVIISMFGVFISSFTRILSRPTYILKSRILGVVRKPSLRAISVMISRYVRLVKNSESLAVMFIALMFTSALFSSISAVTGATHMRELYLFDTGADVVIDAIDNYENVTLDLIQNFTAIDGVLNASGMLSTAAHVSYLQIVQGEVLRRSIPLSIYAVQPNEWAVSAYLRSYFAMSQEPKESLSLLAENETNVISTFMPYLYITGNTPLYHPNLTINFVGPPTNVTFFGNFSYNYTIVDSFSSSYSLNSVNYMPGEAQSIDFIIMNLTRVHALLNTSRISRFYLDIDDTKNVTQIVEELRAIAPSSLQVISTQERIDNLLTSRTSQSINGVYSLNVIFALTYLVIGITIISVVRTHRLQKYYSILRAFGSHTRSVLSSIVLDSFLSVSVGCLIGLFLGLYLSNLILQLPLVFLGLSGDITWTRLPIELILPSFLIGTILFIGYASAILSVIVTTRRALSGNIADDFRHE